MAQDSPLHWRVEFQTDRSPAPPGPYAIWDIPRHSHRISLVIQWPGRRFPSADMLGCWPPVAPCKASLMPQVEAWRAAKSEGKAQAKKKLHQSPNATIYDHVRLCFVCVAIFQSMFSVLTHIMITLIWLDSIGPPLGWRISRFMDFWPSESDGCPTSRGSPEPTEAQPDIEVQRSLGTS
jgi:hypothetical protein